MTAGKRAVGIAATAAVTVTLGIVSVGGATQAQAEDIELLQNGDFTDGRAPWWKTGNLDPVVTNGQLCAEVPGGTDRPAQAIIGQNDLRLRQGEDYHFSFTASASRPVTIRTVVQEQTSPFTTRLDESPSLTTEQQTFEFEFTATADSETTQVAFQLGGEAEPWTFCLDQASLTGPPPPDYLPDPGPRVKVNQVGYLTDGPKQATVVSDATEPLTWELRNSADAVVANGSTVPYGLDESSDQHVHTVDFSDVTTIGDGFTLTADGETSYPFAIANSLYDPLRVDALELYYTQRSGIEILDSLAPGYGRPAGHVGVEPNQGDVDVPCYENTCDYTLDVSGGWYDAGDHGKYVVNGGISAWQVMNVWERATLAPTGTPDALDDGTLSIPEQGNGVPDVLDEARWQIEFLLSMQVPEGEELAGMAHHMVHDESWTAIPMLPHDDPRARYLYPPSTAATLNVAAVGAQCARLFEPYDTAFAQTCRTAAESAWDAAVANPDLLAQTRYPGGGAYQDNNVDDEFYWAAAELFLTTGEQQYEDAVLDSPWHTADAFEARGFFWQATAPLARLQLATVPNDLPGRDQVQQSVVDGAQDYLGTVDAHGYGLPYAPDDGLFGWGSNSQALNNMVVMATAYDLTSDPQFRDGVLTGMNYILGRNAINQSYVTGYGTVYSENQHSRWYANWYDPELPHPPDGTLAGGANSRASDGIAQERLQGCAPQFCYVDHIRSPHTNELTINWNASLAWVASFLADQENVTATCESEHSSEPTVAFGEIDSGVPNHDRGDGCTILDLVWAETPFAHRGELLRQVTAIAGQFHSDGLITARERAAIIRAAAQSKGLTAPETA